MNWAPTEKEVQSVIGLSAHKRYKYWIKKVSDQQEIWSLWQDGWALAGDDEGHELVPVWPHSRYAELCATGQWANFAPRVIDLRAWLDRWIPGVEKDARRIVIFPTSTDSGITVEPRRLELDLREELTRY